MVAGPADHPVAAIGGISHLYRQFRHRLGTLSVFLIHGRRIGDGRSLHAARRL